MDDFRTRLNVSRETSERLSAFVDLLTKWNSKINLVSKSSMEQVWIRHVWDSVQIYGLAPKGGLWTDLGSGGGFPGIVVAILALQASPDQRFVLVESDQRKATFLRVAIRELGLNATVDASRIESLPPANSDILSARALADLSTLLAFSDRHLSLGGIAIFPKGENWTKEVAAARAEWSFDLETHTSVTDPSAAILLVKGINRV
ncbi:MAG: 16S rRNA (guanine(527)-N(7))-methyltransferase RsmG [Sulfitobacter sp.]